MSANKGVFNSEVCIILLLFLYFITEGRYFSSGVTLRAFLYTPLIFSM
jgi:hypothetical protein